MPDPEPVELSPTGTLWGWTTVTATPPGSLDEAPFGFGVVELSDGLRVVTRLALPVDGYEFGQPMHLGFVDLPGADNDDPVTTWEFHP